MVGQGMPYSDSTYEEKYVTTKTSKKGRLLSVTEEAVFFDQTGQMLRRAMGLGEVTADEREEVIMTNVIDDLSTVYRPSGAAETFYSSGNNNLITAKTPLVDWTDLQEVMAYHALSTTDDRAGTGKPIAWQPKILLTSVELAGVAARIINATEVRTGTAPNSMITGNPLPLISLGGIVPLSSAHMDVIGAAATGNYDDGSDWFLGDFKKQFIWQEIWPLATFRQKAGNEDEFKKDVVLTVKVRYYGGIAAIDERYVVKADSV